MCPARAATAPVNAPFSCPNNSASIRLSGRAAQFTLMNGCSARGLMATNSARNQFLAVPLSPRMSTVVGLSGHAHDRVIDAAHRLAAADQSRRKNTCSPTVRGGLRLSISILRLSRHAPGRFAARENLRGNKEFICAEFTGLDSHGAGLGAGKRNQDKVFIDATQFAQHIEAFIRCSGNGCRCRE